MAPEQQPPSRRLWCYNAERLGRTASPMHYFGKPESDLTRWGMLVIRQEQIAILAESRFLQRLQAFVQQQFPDYCFTLGDEELTLLLRNAILRAESFNIRRECDIARYVSLMLAHAADSRLRAEPEWCVPILLDQTKTAPERLRLIQLLSVE